MTIVEADRPITGGVDTHLDAHVAAAIDHIGGLLGVKAFPTTPAGYRSLTSWLRGFGPAWSEGMREPVCAGVQRKNKGRNLAREQNLPGVWLDCIPYLFAICHRRW